MGIFRRKKKTANDSLQAIDAFWRWWGEAQPAVARSIRDSEPAKYASAIAERVHAIHPRLSWEIGPGVGAEFSLTVTASGDTDLRQFARRWLRWAPESGPTWSYADFRRPGPVDGELQLGDVRLDLAELRVATTRSATGLDVLVYHPAFASVPPNVHGTIVFVNLDHALGEEAVELWIDAIEWTTVEPPESIPFAELPALVAEVARENMPDGEMGWTMLQGQGSNGPLLVMCLNRLVSVQAPDFDQHVAVTAEYRDLSPDGWPGEGSLDALRVFEDHLSGIIAGSGMLVAVESCAGVRTMHYFVDSTTPAGEQLRAATSGWNQGRVTITAEIDPSWEAVKRLRM